MRRAGLVLLLAVSVRAEGLAGRWTIDIARAGWGNGEGRGTLLVERDGDGGWLGSLHLPRLWRGEPVPLFDFRFEGDTFRFRLDHPTHKFRFDGRVEASAAKGICVWGEELLDWRATRRAVHRFDEKTGSEPKLPRGEPERLGLHASGLDTLIENEARRGTAVLLVARKGRVVCERHFEGPQRRVDLGRATRLFTALAAGLLAGERRLAFDDPLARWYPEWKGGSKGKVELGHLLTHASGIDPEPALDGVRNRLQAARRAKVGEPGTVLRESDAAFMLVGGVVARVARQRLDLVLDKRLLQPLEIWDWEWDKDGAKHALAYTGLRLPARDLARVGMLIARDGKWNKRTVVPPRILHVMAKPAAIDRRCSLLGWRRERPATAVYQTAGGGQGFVVYPDLDLVALRFGAANDGFDGFLRSLEKIVRQ